MGRDNSFIIDSSVLIAFYDVNDIQHEKAVITAKEVIDSTIYLHPYVIQEVVTILTYRFGVSGAKRFLNNVMNSENILILFFDIKKETEFFLNLNKKIALTDAVLIKLAKEKGLPILTFDKQIISILKK